MAFLLLAKFSVQSNVQILKFTCKYPKVKQGNEVIFLMVLETLFDISDKQT